MSIIHVAALMAGLTLVLPAALAAKWIVHPPYGRTRRGPALVLGTTVTGIVGQALTFAGAYDAAGVVRVFGSIVFALMCVELLNRAPRAR